MNVVSILNILLIVSCILCITYFEPGLAGLMYSLSRMPILVYNLNTVLILNMRSKTVSLHVRRLLKIMIFYYEVRWTIIEISTGLSSDSTFEIEDEVKEETFIDQKLKQLFR